MAAGGFDANFIDLPDNLTCPICHVGMRDPNLTLCGHRVCGSCLEPLRKDASSFQCPVCRTELTEKKIFPDNAVKRDVLNLIVKCNQVESGCEWKGELRQLEEHDESCLYLPLQCLLQCGVLVMRLEMDNHTGKECLRRKVACKHCKLDFESQHLSNHFKECPQYPIECPQRCGQVLVRCQIEYHISRRSSGTCLNTMVDCPLKECGCEVRCKRVKMKSHMEKEMVSHFSSLSTSHFQIKKEMSELKETISELKLEMESVLCVYTWHVTEWSERLKKAMEDETIYYESNAFYTSEPGHHMTLRLYPNDCDYADHFVGLYLFCVKGDYDGVIKWPFRRKFRLILVNQRETKNDKEYVKTIEELEEDAGYTKPDEEGFGSGMINLNEIDKFVKENVLFAKVVIYGW